MIFYSLATYTLDVVRHRLRAGSSCAVGGTCARHVFHAFDFEDDRCKYYNMCALHCTHDIYTYTQCG